MSHTLYGFLSTFAVRMTPNETLSQISSFCKDSSLILQADFTNVLLCYCFNLLFLYTLIPNLTKRSLDAETLCDSQPLVWPITIPTTWHSHPCVVPFHILLYGLHDK